MSLSDRSIRAALEQGRIAVDPFDPGLLQPSSLDIRVDHRFRVFAGHRYPFIDPREPQPELTTEVVADHGQPLFFTPASSSSTLEWVRLSADTVAPLEDKSGVGRLGLLIYPPPASWIRASRDT